MTPSPKDQEKSDKTTRVEFKYTEADSYRVVHGSGAYGGINGQGNIAFEIYTEYQSPPDKEEKEITEDNQVIDVPQEEGKTTVKRIQQIGIVMSLGEAKSFVDWLQGKVEDLEQQKDVFSSEGS